MLGRLVGDCGCGGSLCVGNLRWAAWLLHHMQAMCIQRKQTLGPLRWSHAAVWTSRLGSLMMIVIGLAIGVAAVLAALMGRTSHRLRTPSWRASRSRCALCWVRARIVPIVSVAALLGGWHADARAALLALCLGFSGRCEWARPTVQWWGIDPTARHDDFAILLLDELTAGTTICATSTDAWVSSNHRLQTNERTVCPYTNGNSNVAAGSVLTASSFSGSQLQLLLPGDTLIVYEGSSGSPNFLCALSGRQHQASRTSMPTTFTHRTCPLG